MHKVNEAGETQYDRHAAGCIYCGTPGPYTGEHVIPAGIGGDDKNWILKDCVCSGCNTERFSSLEANLMRSSTLALSRLFRQPYTRNRDERPSIHTKFTYYRDPVTGFLLVANLQADGQGYIPPQIICTAHEEVSTFSCTGPNATDTEDFIKKLFVLFSNDFYIIRKLETRLFTITLINVSNETIKILSTTNTGKPPKEGIWIDDFESIKTPEVELPPWSIHQRPEGQIICRMPNPELSLALFHLIASHRDKFMGKIQKNVIQSDTKPSLYMQMEFNPIKAQRAMIKIGLNIIAHLNGPEIMRREEFDQAVDFVKSGSNPLPCSVVHEDFGPVIPDTHVFILTGAWPQPNVFMVFLLARLYESETVESYQLARSTAEIPGLNGIQVVHVRYKTHEVKSMSLEDHAVVAEKASLPTVS